MNTPDISIIIPCYNDGAYIEDAVKSIFEYKGKLKLEVILINDGSTDSETLKILDACDKQYKIKLIHKANGGLSSARNAGIAAAKASYFIPLDADDIINGEFIEAAFIKINLDKTIDIVFGNSEYFGEKSGVFNANWNEYTQFFVNGLNATALVKKNIWEKCGGYDETMRNGYEDWEFWINAFNQKCKFEKVEMIAFKYRIKKNSMVTDTIKKHKEVLNYIHQKHHDLFLNNYINLNRQLHDVKNNRKKLIHFLIRNLFGKVN